MPSLASLSSLLALSLAFPAAEEPATRMTPELLWKLGRVSDPQLSPNGEWIVFKVTRYDLEKNAGNADLWLLRTEDLSVRRLTTHEKGDSNARWSPDGETIGFVSSRGEKPQVWTISPFGGEAAALTDVEEGVSNFQWSPDGKRISFTSKVRLDPELKTTYPDLPEANARILDDLLYRHWDSWYDGTYSHLFVLDVEGGDPVDLMKDERVDTPLVPFGGGEQIAWSPDGTELCYTAKIVDDPEASTDSDLYVVNVSGGEATCVTDGLDGFDRTPLYSPDGKYLAWTSMERAGFEADRERLMVLDRATGERRELTAEFPDWVSDFTWSPDSRSIVFSSATKGTTQLFRIALDGTLFQLTEGRHNLGHPIVSPDGGTIYALKSTMERPYELVRVPGRGGAPEAITHVNDDVYEHLELPTVEEKWVETTDGKRMHCWVIKPPGFDASKKYPMLTYCQGGPQSPITQWFSYRWNFHLMAANGYVVVAPNRRGLPGFGQDWNDAISRDWGGQAMKDYLSATDAMFEEAYVDRERTAAIGASFGGYSVYWLMGHDQEDRFCAMISHCGLFNLESWHGVTEELWFANWDVGPPYWTSPEAQAEFDANSPHRFVAAWDTPLLVIHGEKDYRVPIGEGMQAFTAAQRMGVPSRFLYFPEEGHWVLGAQNGVLWHRVFFDWLDRWCKPSEG